MDGRNGRGRHPRQRFFGTTRGRVLALLCRGRSTVGELASHVGLTGPAVRAQLKRLQRDGLVRPAGSRRGVSKPHVDYELTPKAHELFPRAYEPVLRTLIECLTDRLDPKALSGLFGGVAARLLQDHAGAVRATHSRRRLSEIVAKLGGQAAGIELENNNGMTVVRACSCPIASVTAAHPELCAALADAIGEMVGARTLEKCDRGDAPRCCFEILHQ